MNITEKYIRFLKDLQQNPNIEINQDREFIRTELVTVSGTLKKDILLLLLETCLKQV